MFIYTYANLHVRISANETLLLEGGVSKCANGTRWLE